MGFLYFTVRDTGGRLPELLACEVSRWPSALLLCCLLRPCCCRSLPCVLLAGGGGHLPRTFTTTVSFPCQLLWTQKMKREGSTSSRKIVLWPASVNPGAGVGGGGAGLPTGPQLGPGSPPVPPWP